MQTPSLLVSEFDIRWFIAQPCRRRLGGLHLERLGYWKPNNKRSYDRSIVVNTHRIKYWIAVSLYSY